MSTSFVKCYEQECTEDEEIHRNEAAEYKVASREPDFRELVEIVAAQNEHIAALNAKMAQLAHANLLKHRGDERRHRELLGEIEALRHSLSKPAIPVIGNMGRRSDLPNPFSTLGNVRPGSWPQPSSFHE